jgi:hypothetical protein
LPGSHVNHNIEGFLQEPLLIKLFQKAEGSATYKAPGRAAGGKEKTMGMPVTFVKSIHEKKLPGTILLF